MEGPRQDGKFAETLEVRLCARARARARLKVIPKNY